MEERFIDQYDVILLDMGNTFMFEVDRFGEDDGLGRTYSKYGGKWLSGDNVFQILSIVFGRMIDDGKIEANYETMEGFPEYLERLECAASLPPEEKAILEDVFTEHEIGVIPDRYAGILRELHSTHRLGLISDICSRSDRFFRELENSGLKDIFDVIVFSSDIGIIKPSGKIFAKALEGFDTDVSKVVYIGDSFRRDIVGAKKVGLSAIWIQRNQVLKKEPVEPDLIINDLSDVLI